jgi:hypothetical protein
MSFLASLQIFAEIDYFHFGSLLKTSSSWYFIANSHPGIKNQLFFRVAIPNQN